MYLLWTVSIKNLNFQFLNFAIICETNARTKKEAVTLFRYSNSQLLFMNFNRNYADNDITYSIVTKMPGIPEYSSQ